MPARWGLQQTTLAPGSDKTQARNPLVRYQVDVRKISKGLLKIEKIRTDYGPVLLRQGEPGTSQCIEFGIYIHIYLLRIVHPYIFPTNCPFVCHSPKKAEFTNPSKTFLPWLSPYPLTVKLRVSDSNYCDSKHVIGSWRVYLLYRWDDYLSVLPRAFLILHVNYLLP